MHPIAAALHHGWVHPTIADLNLGQEVWVWSTGAMRLVTVESKARTRVTVTFKQKNGTKREKAVPADLCWVPDPTVADRLVAPAWIRTHHDRRTLVVGYEDVAVWRAASPVWVDGPEMNTVTGKPHKVMDHAASTEVQDARTIEQITPALARYQTKEV